MIAKAFRRNDENPIEIVVSNFGQSEIPKSNLLIEVSDKSASLFKYKSVKLDPIKAGSVSNPVKLSFKFKGVSKPTPLTISATLEFEKQELKNQWQVWLFPPPSPRSDSTATVFHHSSFELHADQYRIKTESITKKRQPSAGDFLITTVLDLKLLEMAKSGINVLLLANNKPGSFQTKDHWFLRGGPVIDDRMGQLLDRTALVDLQHFDLAGPVIPQVGLYPTVDVLMGLWDNHDLKEVKTHGLVVSLPVGKGNVIVSSLNHAGKTNSAGQYLLKQLVSKTLPSRPKRRRASDASTNESVLEKQLKVSAVDLSKFEWKFQPDEKTEGVKSKWFETDFDDSNWKTIRIGQHWESQGYKSLDNWAWYRLKTKIPADWKSKKIYLNFTGVDDHYRLYVNGTLIGTDGDIKTKSTAFDHRKSWNLTDKIKPGEEITIAIGVLDWQGAGGIFRPAILSSLPIQNRSPLLKHE